MKYLKEIAIIFGITMIGELLNQWIPFPVPAGVYGLFILLGLLCSGAVKLQDVQATGNLLLDLMRKKKPRQEARMLEYEIIRQKTT